LFFAQSGLIRDQKKGLKSHKAAVKGNDFVNWLVKENHVSGLPEAKVVGCSLLQHGLIHSVGDDTHFKDNDTLYRWRYDDKTFICA
jgi:phosphatidylinositol-3,4,5-trisphosphate-dependent Rac exchanger protein 1